MGNSMSNVKHVQHEEQSNAKRSSSSRSKSHSSSRSSKGSSRKSPITKSSSLKRKTEVLSEKVLEEEQPDFKKLRTDAVNSLTLNTERIDKYTKLLKSIQEKLIREPNNKLLLTNKKKAIDLLLRLKETKKAINRQIDFYDDEVRLQELIDEDAAANPAGGRLIRRKRRVQKGTRKRTSK
jgi:hypothetical protein